jgi:large subunit ribosomal protein L21
MFAVIETGGKQYLIRTGQTLTIEKITGEEGSDVTFDKVLLLAKDDGSDVQIGKPYLEGVSISATIEKHARDRKIRVVKFKRKIRYKRVIGHRQHFSRVKIGTIGA